MPPKSSTLGVHRATHRSSLWVVGSGFLEALLPVDEGRAVELDLEPVEEGVRASREAETVLSPIDWARAYEGFLSYSSGNFSCCDGFSNPAFTSVTPHDITQGLDSRGQAVIQGRNAEIF